MNDDDTDAAWSQIENEVSEQELKEYEAWLVSIEYHYAEEDESCLLH